MKNQLSSRECSNIKYWRVSSNDNQFKIEPGISWGQALLVQCFVCALSYGLYRAALLTHDAVIISGMLLIAGSTAAFCLFYPFFRYRSERKDGVILLYDNTSGVVNLPRHRLSLSKSQIVHVRIVAEIPSRVTKWRRNLYVGVSYEITNPGGLAELQLVYTDPSVKSVVVVRSGGGWKMFRDIIKGVKKFNIAPIIIAEKQLATGRWNERTL